MSSISKKNNLFESINLSEYTFDKIKINSDSDTIEIRQKGITFIFGGNGTGKTTISKTIYENNIDSFHYFSYEDNHEMRNDKLIIAKNQNIISNLEKELNDMNNEINFKINNLFKKVLKISSGSRIYKYLLKECNKKILKNNHIISKDKKIIEDNFSDLNRLNEIRKNLLKNNDLNQLIILVKKFENIDKNDYASIEKLFKILSAIKNNNEIIQNKLKKQLSKLIQKNQLSPLKEIIFMFLTNSNIDFSEIEKCIICNQKIESWEIIISDIKKEIDEYKQELNNVKYIEEIEGIINSSVILSKELDIDLYNPTPVISNLLLNNFDLFFDKIKNLKEQIEKIIYLIESEISTFFTTKKNNIQFIDYYIDKLNEKNKLENEKIINDSIKTEYELIISYITEKISINRIDIDPNEKAIIVDNKIINNDNDMQQILSTGEKKFITFCFSLIFCVLENKNKTIIIDDPFCSYDSNNEYNIIYIINYFVNFKKIKFLIFTHSWNFLSIHSMSELLGKNSERNDIYYIMEKTLFNDENNVFVKKICEIENKNDIKKFGCFFSNNYFLDWIRNRNDKFISEYLIDSKKFNYDKYTLFIYSILPIIRGYLKMVNIKDKHATLNKLMHFCNKTFYTNQKDENDKFINDLWTFFLIDTKKYNFEKINNLLNKIIKNMFEINLKEYRVMTLDNEKDIDKIILNQLNKLLNILILRKELEYILLKKIYSTSDIEFNFLKKYGLHEDFNIYKLLIKCKSKINKKNEMLIKSKRIFINGFTHLERLNNYILPLFELTEDLLQKNNNFINEIEREN